MTLNCEILKKLQYFDFKYKRLANKAGNSSTFGLLILTIARPFWATAFVSTRLFAIAQSDPTKHISVRRGRRRDDPPFCHSEALPKNLAEAANFAFFLCFACFLLAARINGRSKPLPTLSFSDFRKSTRFLLLYLHLHPLLTGGVFTQSRRSFSLI